MVPPQSAGPGALLPPPLPTCHSASPVPCVSGLQACAQPSGASGPWVLWGCVGRGWSESRGPLPNCTDPLCVRFLCSVQRVHPADASHQQSDQDPLPHCQEDARVSSQRPPVSPVPALLAVTAALAVQVGRPHLGCRGPGACRGPSWPHRSARSTVCRPWNRLIFLCSSFCSRPTASLRMPHALTDARVHSRTHACTHGHACTDTHALHCCL